MDRDTLIRRLMQTFLQELDEHVAGLNRDLLALEKAPDSPQRGEWLRTLMRAAHSLKGAARAVNLSLLESACHHLEDILVGVRDQGSELTPDMFRLLFAAADALEEAGMRLREGQDLADSPLAFLLPQLAAGKLDPTSVPLQPRSHRPPPSLPEPALAPPAPSAGEPAPAPPSAPVPIAAAEPSRQATVRIDTDKLDAFLGRSGELLVARQRVLARIEDLQHVCDLAARYRAGWRGLERLLTDELSGPERKSLGPRSEAANGRRPGGSRALEAVVQEGKHWQQMERELERLMRKMRSDGRALEQAADELDDAVRAVRMLPFAEACAGLDRLVRDLGQTQGKEVCLVVQGGTVEMDRSILEALKDPLRHLVRNAVDHGIEKPEQRQAAGKPTRATVCVAAQLRGSQVEVQVSDDGRGLDLEAVRAQLRGRQKAVPTDPRELARLIFEPGFSTAQKVTDVSGRGVGLDVVKGQVEKIHGNVEVSFRPGAGTGFLLILPLTLTTLRALLVKAGGAVFVLANSCIEKLLPVDPERLPTLHGRPTLALDGALLPVAPLSEVLGLTAQAPETATSSKPAVLMAAAGQRAVFLVDELLSEQEIVLKSLGPRIRYLPHVLGATLLPSGRVALVLNSVTLVATAQERRQSSDRVAGKSVAAARRTRILVADDSLTTRTLEKSILEAAGYDVQAAVDGQDAWQLLQERGADLLVSDVDMPRMDGFALTEAVRGSPRFKDLPIVLVTAQGSDRDRARGLAVGASAYLVKSAFDQKQLLDTIALLI